MGDHGRLPGIGRRAAVTFLKTRTEGCKIAFQPIVDLRTGRARAYRALVSPSTSGRVTDDGLDCPEIAGLDRESELALIARAIGAVRALPEDVALAVSASAETVASGLVAEAIAGYPLEQIILEVVGDLETADEAALLDETLLLQFIGVRIALNGPGSGHMRVRQILRGRPDLVRIDRRVVSRVECDREKRSLVAGHVTLAREIGAVTVADGIRTRRELAVLRAMGVDLGRGRMTGRPAELSTVLAGLSFARSLEVTH